MDFLFNHLPDLTQGQRAAQAELRRMTTDAFWAPLLPNDQETLQLAHILLEDVRRNVGLDYGFSRKYGAVFFTGTIDGPGASIMKE